MARQKQIPLLADDRSQIVIGCKTGNGHNNHSAPGGALDLKISVFLYWQSDGLLVSASLVAFH
jgi:hypothetical protein